MLFAPPAPPVGLLAEPSDIVQRSSNPPPLLLPPRFVDAGAKDGEAVETGDATADRADIGLMAGIAAYAGAVAGVELGRPCDEAASIELNEPKGCGCAD